MSVPPLPPQLDGPITTATRSILVDNLLPHALVTVYSNGLSVAHATTTNPGSILVPLPAALHHGSEITATQRYTGSDTRIDAAGTSDHSNAIPVQALPNPLPPPIFVSGLTTCTDAVYLAHLIPGAKITVTQGTKTWVDAAVATQTTQAFTLSPGTLAAGSSSNLRASQTVGSNTSLSSSSLPVEVAPRVLPAPVVEGPLFTCQTAINLSSLVPSADFEIGNGGGDTFAVAAWGDYYLYNMSPLQAGVLSARQYFKRCDHPASPTATFTVSTANIPLPVVDYEPCGDIRQLYISNLIPGSVLTLFRVVTSGRHQTKTSIGSQGVSGKTSTVNLPSSFEATDSLGTVSLRVEVSLCSASSGPPGYTTVTFANPGGPYEKPTVRAPLYTCASTVIIGEVHPGSQIQIFSGSLSSPRCNPVIATGPEVVVQLWTPLVVGESIFARQLGCNSNVESAHLVVHSVKPDQPVIATPVRPGIAFVPVSNVLPGALVYLLVNGFARSQTVALDSSVLISVGAPSLVNGDVLKVIQSLCTLISAPGSATVAIGSLTLSVTPLSLITGEHAEVVVTATDSQTGGEVSGLPVIAAKAFNGFSPIGPTSSGYTGTSFSYTPGENDTTWAVHVAGSPSYIDTLYEDLPVTVPPPEMPTDLSPINGTFGPPLTLRWKDPGAGTSRAAEWFSITFVQDGHLVEPTPEAAISPTTAGATELGPVSNVQAGQIQWRISGSNAGGTGPYAVAPFTCITSPYISVVRSTGDEFVVTGSNFTMNGSVNLQVMTAIAGATTPISRTITANLAGGGFSYPVNCSSLCSQAHGGMLVFSAMDDSSHSPSNMTSLSC